MRRILLRSASNKGVKKFIFCALMATVAHVQAQVPNPLTIPPVVTGGVINLSVQSASMQFLAGNATATYGINQDFLGPTIILNRGQSVQMNVTNNLADTSTMHWHGMHVAAANDGGPHTPIAPGETWSPSFTVMDEASTLWYHPHLHLRTTEQVYKGAAGLIIVHDSLEASLGLPHTYGVDDFPLILQDKSFDSLTNAFIYEAMGDTVMVNGTLNPFLAVPAQMVRFRLLNGSNQRVFNLGFPPTNIAFQIASDGGLLERPLPITRMQLAPGERAEVVVDFSNITSNFPMMANNSELGNGVSGGPNGPGGGPGNPLDGNNFPVIDFHVVAQTANPVTSLPQTLRTYDIPTLQEVDRYRTKLITMDTSGFPYYINGAMFDHHMFDDTVRLGDTEIWELINTTDVAHPFHIHDVQFHIIEKNSAPPMDHLAGRKDVVLLQPNDTIKFIARFEDFADETVPYMYHCHNLYHEDGGMMLSFIVRDSVLSNDDDPQYPQFDGLIGLYPNPNQGTVHLQDNHPDGQKVIAMELFDLQGRKLKDIPMDLGSKEHEIPMHAYVPGIYLLRVHLKDGKQSVHRLLRQ